MKMKINTKKAVLWGTILIILQMIIGNMLYMNPVVANINKQFEGHPSIKSFDFLGGLENWIILTMVFGIFLMIIWIFLYKLFYSSLPGKGWIKGLYFGIIIGFIKSVPEAFNQWMVINYPTPLILIQLFNTFISLVIFGALLGFLYSKFKVITYE
jgi:hypothetical protein